MTTKQGNKMFVSVDKIKIHNIVKGDKLWCRKEKKWVDHQEDTTDFDFIEQAQKELKLINDKEAKIVIAEY